MRVWAKRITFLLLPLFLLMPATTVLSADRDARGPQNEISIDLAMPVVLNVIGLDGYTIPICLFYQRVLADHLVISVNPNVFYIDQSTRRGLLGTLWLEFDWHPFQNGLGGLFVGPAVVAVAEWDIAQNELALKTTALMLGASLGYQVLLPSNFSIDVVVGLAVGVIQGYGTLQGLPRAAVALGYRF